MKTRSTSAVVAPTFEDEATLYSLATEYLHAAEILIKASTIKLNVSLVIFFLLGHAAELLLKSLLFKAGTPLTELKYDIGHDLEKLVNRVQDVCTNPPLSLPHILALAEVYRAKSTEYRQPRESLFPAQDLLLREVQELSLRVFNRVAESSSEA